MGGASSPFTHGMRAAGRAWPLGGGTIGDVSTTFPPGRLRGHELLAAVAEGTAGAVGDEFLRCLAQHVAEAFAAKMVLIGEADDPTGMHVRTLPAGTTARSWRSRSSTTPPARRAR